MITKNLRVFSLLVFFCVFSALVPRAAYALTPAAIGGYGLPDATAAGAASNGTSAAVVGGAVDLFAAGSLIAVGAAMSYYAITYAVGPDTFDYRMPLTTAQPVPAPAVAGTVSPVNQRGYSVGGGTAQQIASCGDSYFAQSLDSACRTSLCDAGMPSQGAYSASGYVLDSTIPDDSGGFCVYHLDPAIYGGSGSPAYMYMTAVWQSSCDTGYTLVNGVCVLGDARAAKPDKACDLARTGSALSAISDPDCAA